MSEMINLQTQFHLRMSKLMNNINIPLFLKEHYSESPDWKNNNDINNMINTLIWMTYSDEEKKNLLDEELEDYNKRKKVGII